jgi:hypothetical protein
MNRFLVGALALAGAGLVTVAPAHAADNVMKTCGAQYQAAKAGKTLPAGQTWNQYLAQCRAGLKTTPAASPAASTHALAPSAAPMAAAKPASHLPGAQSPAMVAMHDRQRQCGTQWKADKAAGKIPAGQKWPQYWSACNKRLKA